MAKRRSLQEDAAALLKKVKAVTTAAEHSEGSSPVRALKKHLKRVQRKIRSRQREENRMKKPEAPAAT